jgi:predicted GIY-YIG superfamily endonuclease
MTFLYRIFDAADNLLYVGIADNWPARMAQHKGVAHWFSETHKVVFQLAEVKGGKS